MLEEAKKLIDDEKIQAGTIDFLGDCASALCGDVTSMGKLILTLIKMPFLFREELFWSKFKQFIDGIETSDGDCAEFAAWLTENGTKGDNPYRLIQAIDRSDTRRKISYLVNASRCLSAQFISLNTYFRICQTITNCLQEDLEFFVCNITKHGEFEYTDTIQGLINCGLMYLSVIDGNGNDKYTFTPFADTIDKYSLSYENVERYPMCGEQAQSATIKSTKIDVVAKFG